MNDPRVEMIRGLAEPILAAHAAEAVELSCHRQGGQIMIQLLVDKVGGVTLQDCARLNQAIGQALDAEPSLAGSYILEVSSPGLDRPLVNKRDFERAIGEALQVDAAEPPAGSRRLAGRLLAVQHEAIVLTTDEGNVTVPFAAIQRAKKAIRW